MTPVLHLQLLLFTVLGPGGALGFVGASAFAVVAPKDAPWLFRLQRCLLLPIGLCMLGLVIAATHLGTPRNALYVLLGVGRSPLSNEMVATVAFLALSWLFWLLLTTRRLPVMVARLWLVAASVAALAMVRETALAYSIETIPAWNSPVAPWTFWAGALVLGASVALCTLRIAKVEAPSWSWWAIVAAQAVAVVGGAVAMAAFRRDLAEISTAFTGGASALALVPAYELYVVLFCLLGAVAVLLEARSLRRRAARVGQAACGAQAATSPDGQAAARDVCAGACSVRAADSADASSLLPPTPSMVASALLAMGAVIVMRIPFYLSYMTVGL